MCTNCSHIFCKECITQLQKTNGKHCECPTCRGKITPIIEAHNAREVIASLQVYCSEFEKLRCGWQGM